ncbi:MAG: CDP-6-deoxy-delta-3,4-glucoseen reductase [Burkholderiales bacterium]
MPFQVTIKPSDHTFNVDDGESVLSAALREGYVLPYGCRNGACGACKGKVLDGEVDYGNIQPYVLAEFEKKAGLALFCQAKPKSNLVIEAREISGVGQLEVRKLPCRVQQMTRAAHDVMILKLRLPANERLQFLAGQYIDILLKQGKRRSYSMGNAPHDDAYIELHVRNMQNGAFTDFAFNQMKEKDILRFEGPLGTFFLREESDKPLIFVASGTGFAPIKSIIEHSFHVDSQREMILYWGGRRPQDIYLGDLAAGWQDTHENFSFVPVISDALPEDHWHGRAGLVHRAVMQDFPDMTGYQLYACGAPVMVEAAHRDFTAQCALPEEEFFSDAFTPSVDSNAAAVS